MAAKGIPYLVKNRACDSWHRMHFALFLVKNDLFTDPGLEPGTVFSLNAP